jgi:Flp pilus assembly protein TadB
VEVSSLFYILIFTGVAVLLVVAVLTQTARNKSTGREERLRHGTAGASRSHSGSAQRDERKRRRNQSKHDRRKRH